MNFFRLLVALMIACPAMAAPPGFGAGTCTDKMYLSQSVTGATETTLTSLSLATNPITTVTLGTSQNAIIYNATAYNAADGYLYGFVNSAPNTGEVVRIGSDGSAEVVGPIAGIPAGMSFNNGTIGVDGFYYVRNQGNLTTFYKVDLSTLTAVAISFSGATAFATADWAWSNGQLYTTALNGQFYSVNPSTGGVTHIGARSTARTYGAMFGAPNGIFGAENSGTGLFQFDLVTGQPELISDAPGAASNDGANCVTANITFGADIAITKTDSSTTYTSGNNTVYSIVVSNSGPFGATGAIVNDPLPSGVTTASWSCAAGLNGGECGTTSGTGAITNVPVNLPKNATVIFTSTVAIPAGRLGNLVNTATVVPSATNIDTNTANNSTTDTDVLNPVITPVPENGNGIAGVASTPIADIRVNDTVNGVGATGANSTIALDPTGSALPTGMTLDTNTGAIATTIATPAGVYSVKYKLCDLASPTPNCDSVINTVTIIEPPKLTVTKTVSPSTLVVGATGQSYTISIAVVDGPTTAPIDIVDILPSGITTNGVVTITGGSLSGCPSIGASNLTGCTIATGAANGTITMNVPISVGDTATDGNNTASVTGGGAIACVGTTCSGSVTAAVTRAASLTISKTDGKTIATSGTINSYTITLSNAGPSPADNVVVNDTPGSGLTCPGTLGAAAVSCTAANGAQCPGAAAINTASTITYAAFNAGSTVPKLPVAGQLSFVYECTVN